MLFTGVTRLQFIRSTERQPSIDGDQKKEAFPLWEDTKKNLVTQVSMEPVSTQDVRMRAYVPFIL